MAPLLWNLWAHRKVVRQMLRWGMRGTGLLLVAALFTLFASHAKPHLVLGSPKVKGSDKDFDFWHEGYKPATAVQWGTGLLHLYVALAAWRRSDAATPDERGWSPPAAFPQHPPRESPFRCHISRSAP